MGRPPSFGWLGKVWKGLGKLGKHLEGLEHFRKGLERLGKAKRLKAWAFNIEQSKVPL